MKKILIALAFLVHGYGCTGGRALAADPPVSLKGQVQSTKNSPAWNLEVPFSQSTKTGGINALIETGNENMLPNPGFEHSTYSNGWTAGSDATISQGTSTNIGTGSKSLGFTTSNVTNPYVDSTAITIPQAYRGKAAEVSCWFKATEGYGGGTGARIFGYDGTNYYGGQGIPVGEGRVATYFVFPTSGTMRVRVLANTASLPAEYMDDCYMGPARDIYATTQAQFIGSIKWAGTASCQWTNSNSGTFTNFGADTDCPSPTVTGQLTAPGTKIPGFVLQNAGPGQYLIFSRLFAYGTTSTQLALRFSDGTNSSNPVTFYGSASVITSGGNVTGDITLTSMQSTWTVQLQGANGSSGTANIDNAATNSSMEISVYKFPSASQTVVNTTIPNFYPSYSARVGGASETTACTGSPCTIHRQSGSWLSSVTRSGTGGYSMTFATGIFSAAPACAFVGGSSDSMVFRAESSPPTSTTYAISSRNPTSLTDTAFDVVCTSTTPVLSAVPLYVGSVYTGSTSTSNKIESAYLTNSGSCAVSTQSSSWITSVSDPGTGQCGLVWASTTWAQAPWCNVTGIGGVNQTFLNPITTTGTTVFGQTPSGGGTSTDSGFYITCMGPK